MEHFVHNQPPPLCRSPPAPLAARVPVFYECFFCAQRHLRFTVSSLAIKRHWVQGLLSGTIWDQVGGAAGPGGTVQFVMSILGKWQCHSFAV